MPAGTAGSLVKVCSGCHVLPRVDDVSGLSKGVAELPSISLNPAQLYSYVNRVVKVPILQVYLLALLGLRGARSTIALRPVVVIDG